MNSSSSAQHFHPPLFFRATALFLLVASVYLAGEARRTGDTFVVLFFVVVLVSAVAMSLGSLAQATWEDDVLSYRLPLRPLRRLHRKQIIDVEVVGRRTRALLIRYHPLDERGRIDSGQEAFLNMTPLQDQMILRDLILGESGSDA